MVSLIEQIEQVEQIERDIAPIEVAVSNMGANVRFSITETTARVYQMVWEMACFSGVLMGREVTKVMPPRSRGTIIFIGATASLRGREGFAAIAGAKHAPQALAQSMVRALRLKGIHVAHPIINGAIDTDFIRTNCPDRYATRDQGGILNPDHIAAAYGQVHRQPRDLWTHEAELLLTAAAKGHTNSTSLAYCSRDKTRICPNHVSSWGQPQPQLLNRALVGFLRRFHHPHVCANFG